jgi:hypothetical protein
VGAIEEVVGEVADTTKVVDCEGEELDVVSVEGRNEGSGRMYVLSPLIWIKALIWMEN